MRADVAPSSKMAASSYGIDELGSLSTLLGIPSELITELASGSEEVTKVLLKVKDYCDGQGSKEEKWRAELSNLRRARVNAGLTWGHSSCFVRV